MSDAESVFQPAQADKKDRWFGCVAGFLQAFWLQHLCF